MGRIVPSWRHDCERAYSSSATTARIAGGEVIRISGSEVDELN